MKKIAVEEAIGQELLHDLTAILEGGFKGVRFKRGHRIEAEDIPVLLSMGKEHVYIAEPGDDFVHEEDAAKRVLDLAVGDFIEVTGPSEGKFNLLAACDGCFLVDEEGLYAINATEDYSFATIMNKVPVKKGDLLAGARIIPLLTSEDRVREAEGLADRYFPIFQVLPYRPMKVGMVITGSEIYKGRIKDAFEPILRKKLEAYGAEVQEAIICPDDGEMIEEAILAQEKRGAGLVLITGGMSVDPDDMTPDIIKKLSDRLIFHGLPVQPGNMLTIGQRGETYLIGVPGASMHSKLTSLDLFLPRIFSGLEIRREESIRLGLGGLSICRQWPEL